MAEQARVSRGWSALGAEVKAATEQALRAEAKAAAAVSQLGETWTAMMTQVTSTAPAALTRAREHASRMLGVVR
jgi:hypothetical protein